MIYKAVISDLDGTLLQHGSEGAMQGLPSARVQDAIKKVQHRIHFGIATGRSVPYVTHLIDHLHLSGPVITDGGALIIDATTKKILYEKSIEEESFYQATNILQDMNIPFVIDERDRHRVPFGPEYTCNKPLNIFVQNGLTHDMVRDIQRTVSHIPSLMVHQVPGWQDISTWAVGISHVLATKQHAVLEVANILKITPQEIIGIGDGYNDFPLLMACGLKIAVDNAVQELKDIADYIAPSVDDDGVADVIEKFILSQTDEPSRTKRNHNP